MQTSTTPVLNQTAFHPVDLWRHAASTTSGICRRGGWLLITCLLSAFSGQAATYPVINTNDAGAGSLRQAITDANSNAAPDVIQFAIPGAGTKSIVLLSALPPITDPLVLDGATQPGFTNKPLIELNGANAGPSANGLLITVGRSTVRGLAINRFKVNGIQLQTGGGNVIEDNFIGLDSSGTIDRGNSGHGEWRP